jgi:PAS domain S-box-containing protein
MLSTEINLKSVFSNTIIGLVLLDEQGEIENINKKALELLGYEEAHLIGSHFLNLVIELDKNKVRSYFSLVNVSNGNNTIDVQIREASNEPISIELELIFSDSTVQNKYIGIIKDNSIRKGIEKEVKDLKEAKREADKRLEEEIELNELKSRFVTIASHEFRTPLAGVLSSTQLIRRYLDSEKENWDEFINKSKIETHFDKIEESVLNLNHILNDFLSLGKIDENKINCKYTWFNLPSFLHDMCQELEHLCKAGQKIECQHYGADKEIFLDKHILRNIINNLVSNAIKYSPENKTIHLSSKTEGSFLTIKVRDEGIGIPIAEHKNIFRRFFRAGNAINFEGTGIGLSIVKKYSELMNGNVTFESQENEGTTFFINFSLNEKQPDEKNPNNRR